MTVKEVLNLVVQYIGDSELSKTTILDGDTIADAQQVEKLNLLLTCVNDVSQSLALMYFPLKMEEHIINQNGKVMFDSLKKQLLDIIKITNKNGFQLDFATFPTYFETSKGDLNIIYNYAPKYITDFNDNLEVVENKVTKRLFAIGVVSRYYLISGMYNDAVAWENMFERAILVANRKKTPITIKKRRWC